MTPNERKIMDRLARASGPVLCTAIIGSNGRAGHALRSLSAMGLVKIAGHPDVWDRRTGDHALAASLTDEGRRQMGMETRCCTSQTH